MRLLGTRNDKINVAFIKWTAVHSLALLQLSVLVTSVPRNKLITKGERIKIETMPHTVMILIIYQLPDDMTYCSGSILTHRWVLGAAHCFYTYLQLPRKKGLFKIRFGIDTLSEEGPISDVSMVVCHEGFKWKSANDVCLLQTFDKIPFSERVMPTLKPKTNETVKSVTHVRVAGWGLIENGEYARYLSAVDLPMMSDYQCENLLTDALSIENPGTFFCAGNTSTGKSPCGGDSGSVAVVRSTDNNSWIALGVAVQSKCLGPTLFMSVPYFINWIMDTLDKYP